MIVKKPSITLSGAVLIKGHWLEKMFPKRLITSVVHEGDLRLIAVLSGDAPEVGFVTACIYDGRSWRKFLLRDAAQGAATFKNGAELYRRTASIISTLEGLAARQAELTEHAYAVVAHQLPVSLTVQPEEDEPKLTQMPLL